MDTASRDTAVPHPNTAIPLNSNTRRIKVAQSHILPLQITTLHPHNSIINHRVDNIMVDSLTAGMTSNTPLNLHTNNHLTHLTPRSPPTEIMATRIKEPKVDRQLALQLIPGDHPLTAPVNMAPRAP